MLQSMHCFCSASHARMPSQVDAICVAAQEVDHVYVCNNRGATKLQVPQARAPEATEAEAWTSCGRHTFWQNFSSAQVYI